MPEQPDYATLRRVAEAATPDAPYFCTCSPCGRNTSAVALCDLYRWQHGRDYHDWQGSEDFNCSVHNTTCKVPAAAVLSLLDELVRLREYETAFNEGRPWVKVSR